MRTRYRLMIGLSVLLSACTTETTSAPSKLSDTESKPLPESKDPGPSCDPEPACVGDVLGDGTCTDIVNLKLQATSDLCDEGLSLSAFDVDLGGCPEGQALAAKYACCPTPPPGDQPDKPPPPEDPNASTCAFDEIDVGACVDISVVESSAAEVCASQGAELVDRKFGGDCPDGEATKAWFSCCVPAP
ncbi:MAG: hypothetical protein U0414_19250 [Polyangiaceae bacterium]